MGMFGNSGLDLGSLGAAAVGTIFSRILNAPAINRIRGGISQTGPSDNIPQYSPGQAYGNVNNAFQNTGRGNLSFDSNWNVVADGTAGATRVSRGQLAELDQFRNPTTGEIDWTRAQAAGATSMFGMQPSDVSRNQIAEQGFADIDAALQAGKTDQARANALADEGRAGFQAVAAGLDKTQQDAATGYNQLEQRANDVNQQGRQDFQALQQFQQQQMQELQTMISQGLSRITSEKAEALNGISANMAADVGAATSAARQNFQAQMAQVNSDPNIPPEAREQLQSQLGISTAVQASQAAAPLVRMYRELESNTRTSFANLIGELQAHGQQTTSSLSAAQQATRAGTIESLGRIGAELTGILATAQASRNTLNATVDNLRLQAEATKDDFLLGLLPHQSEPFAVYTPFLEQLYGMGIDEDMLAYSEDITRFNQTLAAEGFQTQVASPYVNAALTPEPPEPQDNTWATLGGSAIEGGASIASAGILDD